MSNLVPRSISRLFSEVRMRDMARQRRSVHDHSYYYHYYFLGGNCVVCLHVIRSNDMLGSGDLRGSTTGQWPGKEVMGD